MTQGRRIKWGSDFVGVYNGRIVVAGGDTLDGDVGSIGVNEGSFASTIDETGGVLAITTDTADNDNHFLIAGPFSPNDGTITMRGRFKWNSATLSYVWFGFAETMDLATPVAPTELTGTTLTVNAGGQVGFFFDPDATTDDWRYVMGDGGAAISDSTPVTDRLTNNTADAALIITADQWVEAEVTVSSTGVAELYFGSIVGANADNSANLTLVKRFNTGTLMTTTDRFYACLGTENRDGNARVLEVDYFEGTAGRDWAYD